MNRFPTCLACTAALALAIVPGHGVARAQSSDLMYGRTSVLLPPQTDSGSFDGTWFYVNRDLRIAMWMQTVDGKVQAKFQILRTGMNETFSTGWDGRATYNPGVGNGEGSFRLDLAKTTADRLEGTWEWALRFHDSSRVETSEVAFYRSADGRQMTMHFPTYKLEIARYEDVSTWEVPQLWTFRKISRRHLLWDEMPF